MNNDFMPILYYYEHCPYCVRVLVFAGIANIKLKYKVLLNDDEKTPTRMIGAKMLPILETAPKQYLAESLDIIDYLSRTYHYPIISDKSLENRVATFFEMNRLVIYGLLMPRWVEASYQEFATDSAKQYFIRKKTETIGDFITALVDTPILSNTLFKSMENSVNLFESLIDKPNSYAAIQLFSGLLGLDLVPDFRWHQAAYAFMQMMKVQSDLS